MAKSSNLLVDGLDQPSRVGLLLPLHWHAVVLLLAAVTTEATVVLAADPGELAGCDAAFVLAEHAQAALDAGVPEVMALSDHPLGLPPTQLPTLVSAYGIEVPGYADHYGGPRPGPAQIDVGGSALAPLPGLTSDDRLLTSLDPAEPTGAAALLAALTAGGSLVLLRSGDAAAVAATERATVTAGTAVTGLSSVG